MTARIPVGVVGVGALGRHHARHLAQNPAAELVGVFVSDNGRAQLEPRLMIACAMMCLVRCGLARSYEIRNVRMAGSPGAGV